MIKFMEFDYTLRFARTHPETFREEALPFSLIDICDKIKKLLLTPGPFHAGAVPVHTECYADV